MNNIDIYNTIYDLNLAVCNKKCKNKDIRSKFVRYDGKELTDADLDFGGLGYTMTVMDKQTKAHTILVRILSVEGNNKTERQINLINTISHEATHVLLDTYDKIGDTVSLSSQEPVAYYLGWICECIYKTYTK